MRYLSSKVGAGRKVTALSVVAKGRTDERSSRNRWRLDARLRARERERQRLAEARRELTPVLEPDAATRFARERLRALLQ